MASYKDIQAQIAELQQQAVAQRESELSGAIQQIRALMQEYGITVDDLQSSRRKAAAKTPAAIQFRHPETGETWSGRGRMPRWMSGNDKEQFRV